MIQFADKTMVQDLKLIWKECFHDPDEYINFFFESYYGEQTTLVYCIEERPISMLTLMPANLHTSDGVREIAYIYAVATLPSYQGKGYSSKLLEYANEITNGETFLQPATTELEQFYLKNGYQKSLYRFIAKRSDMIGSDSELQVATVSDENTVYQIRELHKNDSELYTRKRDEFFEREGYIAWQENVIAFAIAENEFTGGKTLLINDEYLLMYRAYEGILYIREYTMPEDMLLEFIRSIPESKHCKEWRVYLNRYEENKCSKKQVIMSTFPISTQDGYFNLAFE